MQLFCSVQLLKMDFFYKLEGAPQRGSFYSSSTPNSHSGETSSARASRGTS